MGESVMSTSAASCLTSGGITEFSRPAGACVVSSAIEGAVASAGTGAGLPLVA